MSRRSSTCELIEIVQTTHSRAHVSELDVLPVHAEFAALSMAEVSDALHYIEMPGSALGMAPIDSHPRMLDRTFAVRYTPVNLEPGTIGNQIERTGFTARSLRG